MERCGRAVAARVGNSESRAQVRLSYFVLFGVVWYCGAHGGKAKGVSLKTMIRAAHCARCCSGGCSWRKWCCAEIRRKKPPFQHNLYQERASQAEIRAWKPPLHHKLFQECGLLYLISDCKNTTTHTLTQTDRQTDRHTHTHTQATAGRRHSGF
eukprot:946434-Rhodomonas_salina.1